MMKTRFNKFGSVAVGLALAALSTSPAFADGTAPTPLDTTGYGAIFTQLTADMSNVATGPVGLGAFGALTVGLIFRICWKLYKKAPTAF